MSLNEEVHAKLLHDYQVVGWKYSACSFKNKIFIGIFGSTLHAFVVIVVVVFSLFPHPASYWSLVNDGKFCYCFVFMVIDPRCLVSRWKLSSFFKKIWKFCKCSPGKAGLLLSVWFDDHVTVHISHLLANCILPNDHVCIRQLHFFSPILIVISSKFKISEIEILKPQSFSWTLKILAHLETAFLDRLSVPGIKHQGGISSIEIFLWPLNSCVVSSSNGTTECKT